MSRQHEQRVMGKKKICPALTPYLMSNGAGNLIPIDQECISERCAWWLPQGECAVIRIAKSLREEKRQKGGQPRV